MKGLSKTERKIIFYIPNVIGYARLFLLLLAFVWMDSSPSVFVSLYGISILLDYFDGWAARKFNQCSSFGAWLDVVVDNASRSCLWTNLFQWGWLLVCVEWVTFVGNHQAGAKWREAHAKTTPDKVVNPPEFVQKIMANGFKTWRGAWVIAGLHILPIWIYLMREGVAESYLPSFINYLVLITLVSGRILCLACELWCIQKHIRELLEENANENEKSSSSS